MLKVKKLIINIICTIALLVGEYALWRIIPVVWRQGSSSAFEFAIFLLFVSIALPVLWWYGIKKRK